MNDKFRNRLLMIGIALSWISYSAFCLNRGFWGAFVTSFTSWLFILIALCSTDIFTMTLCALLVAIICLNYYKWIFKVVCRSNSARMAVAFFHFSGFWAFITNSLRLEYHNSYEKFEIVISATLLTLVVCFCMLMMTSAKESK